MVFKDQRFIKGGNEPTRFLYVSGVGDFFKSDKEVLRRLFGAYGELDYKDGDAICFIDEMRYCFVCYTAVESAVQACAVFTGCDYLTKLSQELQENMQGITKLYVRYAKEKSTARGPPEPECVSSTAHVVVPGCMVIENFITEEEEEGTQITV